MKTLGLIGGMSWESTAIYYRLLNEGVQRRRGGLHSAKLLLHSVDFAEIAARQAAADWEALTGMMVEAAQRLARGGADALVICTNTMHKCAPAIAQAVALPIVHIADATAAAIKLSAARRPGLIATRYTMQQDFYRGHLRERHGIETLVPDEAGRDRVHGIIYEELCRGLVRPESKAACLGEVAALQARGADGLILGCTEICMLLSQADFAMPVFDTTAIHAEAALDFALAV